MTQGITLPPTPWRKVYARLGLSQAELARELGCHRAKVSRALSDPRGLIHGRDTAKLLKVSRKIGKELRPSDFLPLA